MCILNEMIMADWIDVIAESALDKGEYVLVDINGTDVAVFNLKGEYYAYVDVCPHDGGELASGDIIGDEIICPRHGARFCLKTGQVECPPAYENLVAYPIRVEEGRIQIADEAISLNN